jgi:hypothetical protein
VCLVKLSNKCEDRIPTSSEEQSHKAFTLFIPFQEIIRGCVTIKIKQGNKTGKGDSESKIREFCPEHNPD